MRRIQVYAIQDKGFVVLGLTIRSGWASDIKPDAEKLKMAYSVVETTVSRRALAVSGDFPQRSSSTASGRSILLLVSQRYWRRCLRCAVAGCQDHQYKNDRYGGCD